ncbi:MAG TPA: NAD-dependent epimerase/dehydratase family protein [Thermoflexia bacterium]|nr:NAD-dependent epimerase/dehydratase family protein [Thermoflexia bacterium]
MPEIRCCVLGATGFIGGQIARAALAQGWQVRGLRRRPDAVGAIGVIGDLEIEWVSGDATDLASLVTAMRGCPLVFHAAGYYPHRARDVQETVRHGVLQMRNVLKAASAAGVKRLVYTSALTTVGPPTEPGRLAGEKDAYTPGSIPLPYFEVKWAMEMEAVRATMQGLPVVILLPSVVFGPGDVKPTTGKIMLMAAKGRIPGYIQGEINVVDVRDVAAGHIAAARRGKPGRRYILGGHNLPIREVQTIIAKAAGRKPPRATLPLWLTRAIAETGSWLGIPGTHHLRAIRHWQPLDTARAREELGLPAPIPFEQTCRDALDWFRERDYLKGAPDDQPTKEAD